MDQRAGSASPEPSLDAGRGMTPGDGAPGQNEKPTAPRPTGGPRTRSGGRGGRRPAIAALDLGTNNCRLLVARPEGEGFVVIDAFSRVVRLGEGLNETGRLSDAAMARAVSALQICADRLEKHNVLRFRAIATEACRRAANHMDFLDQVRRRSGLELDVIAPEEEARLAVAGCAPLLDPTAERLIVFDIGGGSTELIRIDLSKVGPAKRKPLLFALAHGASRSDRARAAAAHIEDWISLPAGVVTLSERFDAIIDDRARFEAMHDHVAGLLDPFLARSGHLDATQLAKTQLLGASGTITTIAGVHLDLERYSRREVDGRWLPSDAIDRVIDRLAGMNAYERASIPCVGEDRSTHLMSGAAILRAILRAWPTRRLRVADRGLREGMLYGLLQGGPTGGGGRRRRRRR